MRRVILLTTAFDDVATGPAMYAQQLWKAFRDDPSLEYHVVAPEIRELHERLHESGKGNSSLELYRRLLRSAVELTGDGKDGVVLHANNAHVLAPLRKYAGITLAQINDYRAAEVWCHPADILLRRGPRALARLVWRHRRESRVMRSATGIICNSSFAKQRMVSRYGARPEKIAVVHVAADLASFRRPELLPRDPYPQRPAGARLVMIGSDWRTKGVPDLIAAVRIVRERLGHVHLTIGGPSRPGELAAIRAIAAREGVADVVSLPGRITREQLPRLLWHSDLFVLPTHEESLGVSVYEAMAAGLPVVATRVGGIPEIVRHADEGVLVDRRDVSALALAIIEVLTDESRRASLAEASVRRATEFGVEQMISELRELYESVGAPGRAA